MTLIMHAFSYLFYAITDNFLFRGRYEHLTDTAVGIQLLMMCHVISETLCA